MGKESFLITDFGAQGDGLTDNTKVFSELIEKVQNNGGGEIIVPPGIYLTGSLKLCSNLTLFVMSGAILSFIDEESYYPAVISRWEGVEREVHRACVYGSKISNLTIDGGGTIDGNGSTWWKLFKEEKLDLPRPYLVSIEHSNNIKIKNLTFINSPSWTLHPMECTNIVIDSVTVINPKESPNTDGLDPESCNDVRIVNSVFDVGDDCIAIKSGTEQTKVKSKCQNIIISNCNMRRGHGGVVIGSEMSGDIQNVVISNCIFYNTDRGIRMKTRRGRGGKISDISVSNIIMTGTLCPIVINSYYFCGPSGKEKYVWDKSKLDVDVRTPEYEHISIHNIIAKNVKSAGIFVYGLPEMPIKDLNITDIQIYLDPDSNPIEPAMISNAPKLSQAGIFIENTINTRISTVQMSGVSGEIFVNNTSNKNMTIDNVC